MKTSDKILGCKSCTEYAKYISPNNWQELYNMAWLKTRERELRDPEFEAKHYKTYFQESLRSCNIDLSIKEGARARREVKLGFTPEVTDEKEDIEDIWKIERRVLNEWLNRKPDNEAQLFLQNIVTLAIKCKNITAAAKLTSMSRRTFYNYLKEAKNDIDYEYFITTDTHPLSISDLV